MDEQNSNTSVEELQDQYLAAINSGDDQRIKQASDRIEKALSQVEQAPQTQTPFDKDEGVVQGSDPEVLVDKQEQVQQGAPAPVAKDGDPAPTVTKEGEKQAKDWLESLDPGIRKQVQELIGANKKLEHRISADNGRVAAYQRRYEELQKKAVQQEDLIKRLRSEPTAQPQSSSAASKTVQSNLSSLDDDPDLKAIAETDEQLARVITRREALLRQQLEQQEQRFRQLEERLSPVVKSQEDMHVSNELNRLTQYIPNAIEIFNYRDPESGVNYWEDWVVRQPKRMRELAESDNAEEVAQALRLHIMEMKSYFGYTDEAQQQPVVSTQQQAPVKQPVDPSLAAKVQGERERKLSAQPVGSASVRPPQQAKPTMEQIMADPELLAKYQDEIYKEELKKRYAQ